MSKKNKILIVLILYINFFYGQDVLCLVKDGVIKKNNKEIIRGEGNIKSLHIEHTKKQQNVFSIIEGVLTIYDTVITIESENIKIKYFGVIPDTSLEGKKVTINQTIGITDPLFDYVKLFFFSNDKKQIKLLNDKVCNY